jgi:hypothetical protein
LHGQLSGDVVGSTSTYPRIGDSVSGSGGFESGGRPWTYEIITVESYDGEELEPGDFEEADRVYYCVTDSNGETFYRWLGGPYMSEEDVVGAIEDEVGAYEEMAG